MSRSTSPEKKQHRILIVDDHPIVREGLTQLIQQEKDLVVCGEAESRHEALTRITETDPALVVLDLSIKDGSGLDLIKDIKVRHPKLPTLVLSMHDEATYAERVLKAGGRGYLMKDEARQHIVTAIRQALAGDIYLSPRMSQAMHSKVGAGPAGGSLSPLECLSDRELEIFRCIGQGLSTREISRKLHRSVRTIDSHRENIKMKLNLTGASDLLQRAIQWVQSEKA